MIQKTNNLSFSKYGIEIKKINTQVNKYEIGIYENRAYNNVYYSNEKVKIHLEAGLVLIDVADNKSMLNYDQYWLFRDIELLPNVYFNFHCISHYAKVSIYYEDKIQMINLKSKINYSRLKPSFEIEEIIGTFYHVRNGFYELEEEYHDFWELNYVDIGEMNVVIKEEDYKIKSGELLLIAPYEKHKFTTKKQKMPCSYFTILFRSNKLSRTDIEKIIIDVDRNKHNILNNIIKMAETNEQYAYDNLISYLRILLTEIIHEKEIKTKKIVSSPMQQSYEEEIMNEIIQFINENLESKQLLKEIQNNFSISRSTLQNYFHKNLNLGPKQYITQIKMKKAQKLIYENKLTITEISNHLGYTTVNYFSKAFKQNFGFPPSKFVWSINRSDEYKRYK